MFIGDHGEKDEKYVSSIQTLMRPQRAKPLWLATTAGPCWAGRDLSRESQVAWVFGGGGVEVSGRLS
jgi:hypothetical protein